MTKSLTKSLKNCIAALTATLLVAAVAAPVPALAQDSAATAANTSTSTNSYDGFRAGDRIALNIQQPIAYSDTLVVRTGGIIQIPTVGDISLAGVKRSNLQPYLTQQIGKYLRDPVLTATTLIQVSVVGQVGRPGFYSVPGDVRLSDMVMRAGGPTPNSDLDKSVLKREGNEIMNDTQVRDALATGKTLDDLGIIPGDQLDVAQRSPPFSEQILRYLGIGIPLAGLILYGVFRR